jgi:hypothetical protein
MINDLLYLHVIARLDRAIPHLETEAPVEGDPPVKPEDDERKPEDDEKKSEVDE